ncbi:MAG: T9SS type A sorting domain-containing protein [Ignavibacteria bacterium]|nr:T9SS type A sorting domain-containing protein [Ignavibacteria bacterium]
MKTRYTLKLFLFIVLFVLYPAVISAQVTPEWLQTFGNADSSDDIGRDIAMDKNKNIFVVGTAADKMIVMKYSPAGMLIWEKREFNINGYCVRLDTSGNVHAMGWDWSGNLTLVKYSNSGTRLWVANHQNSGLMPLSMALDKSGNIYVAIHGNGMGIIKFAPWGLFQWRRSFSGIGSFTGRLLYNKSIKTDHLGNIYITGTANTGGVNEDHNIVTVKYNSSGDSLWTRVFDYENAGYDRGYVIDIDDSLNVYTAGITYQNSTFYTVLIKYSPSGNLLWHRLTEGSYDGATDLLWKNNYIYLTGGFEIPGIGSSPVVKFNSGGTIVWTTYYNEPGSQKFYAWFLHVDSNENVYASGTLYPSRDIAAIKYGSNGVKKWNLVYAGPFNGHDMTWTSIFDGNNLILSGETAISYTNWELILIKYRSDPIGIISQTSVIPSKYTLSQNYPNPFNPTTIIKFGIPNYSGGNNTILEVFDISGRLVKTLVNESLASGTYKVEFNAGKLSSGIYFYRLTSGARTLTKKMILVK